MRVDFRVSNFRISVAAIAIFSVGCGHQPVQTTDNETNDRSIVGSEQPSGLPVLAMPGPDDAKPAKKTGPTLLPKLPFGKKKETQDEQAEATPTRNEPEKGSAEWLLNEIQRVRLMPLPYDAEAEKDEDEDDLELTPAQEKKLTEEIERTKGIRRERNLQIVKLAESCIQKTNKNPEQEGMFSTAAHHLLDARLQLALGGDKPSIEALYEADRVFYQRNPQSESSKEASLTLVNFTHGCAMSYGNKDPRWLQEFSKQSQIFATRFPNEAPRSVPLLMAAARSCEYNGKLDEAKSCYALLESKFADTPQGQQATGSLRRMQLKGHELQLSGPGIDGGEIDVKAYRGKLVLVVFWASNAGPFLQQFPKIQEAMMKHQKICTVIGVSLDTDERAVEAFAEEHKISWPQIFFPNRGQRGWNSPIAAQYGVNQLPTIWLLDPNGIVADTNLDASNLDARIREVASPYLKKKK